MSSTTKIGYEPVQVKSLDGDDNRAQMSFGRLSILLMIIGIVWVLCYNAQLQFPLRHTAQTYDRIGQQKITKQSYKYAFDFLTSDRTMDVSAQQKNFYTNKYNLLNQAQDNICVLLIHKQDEKNWMKSVQSLLSQSYKNYKIYYINNQGSATQIYNYIQTNSLDKSRIKIIQNIKEITDYAKQFEYSKNYCNSDDIVIYINDDDRLIGYNVLSLVNVFFQRDEDLKLLYSGSIFGQYQSKLKKAQNNQIIQNKKLVYRLGKTYSYPADIVNQNRYKEYPYLMDGLIAFRGSLLQKINKQQLLNSKGYPYQYANQIIFGINLLQLSQKNTKYLPELLVLRGKEKNFISNNQQFRQQLKDIASRK